MFTTNYGFLFNKKTEETSSICNLFVFKYKDRYLFYDCLSNNVSYVIKTNLEKTYLVANLYENDYNTNNINFVVFRRASKFNI